MIDLGKGLGIGVRAAPNLLRPAHLFLYLKQNRLQELKKATDYFINRQVDNGAWKKVNGITKYDDMAENICRRFAEFTAKLDVDYIFAWLDWDGDNVLADVGIIDYGSVRQFGVRHDRYRYDDVERFSTNLNEQRQKAQLIVQVFVQLADALKTGQKKPLKAFAKHPTVTGFNKHFKHYRSHRLLYRMGFSEIQRERIISQCPAVLQAFDREFSYFERAKISGNPSKVPDGINHPAIFNMRSILKALPTFWLEKGLEAIIPANEFYQTILSSWAKQTDLKLRSKHSVHIQSFQRLFKQLITAAAGPQKAMFVLKGISQRASALNKNRITGNALIQIVDELLTQNRRGLSHKDMQSLIDQLITNHLGVPEVEADKYYEHKPRALQRADIFSKLLDLVVAYQDDI